MRLNSLTLILLLLASASTAWAGGNKIMVLAKEADGERVEVRLDSATMGFWLDELVDGESRSTVTGEGQAVTLTRAGDTVQMDVDGQMFEIPLQHHVEGDFDMNTHVSVDHDAHHAMQVGDDLMIVSAGEIDADKQQLIIDALRAAGVDDEVRFIQSGDKQVRVIKRRIEK